MAKKKGNKPNISQDALQRARAELANEGVPSSVVEPTTKASVVKPKSQPVQRVTSFKKHMTRDELQSEYGYVIADLRSMAILAVVLFVAMIVVSLTLQSVI